MKILMVAGSLKSIGGIEKYNTDLFNSITKLNHNVILVERFPGKFFAKFVFFLKCIFKFFIYKPDYIICGHLNFLPIIYLLRKFKDIKYSVSIYGIEIIPELKSIIKEAINKADKIITISNYTKSLIIRKLPNVENRIFMLKSAVNADEFNIEKKDAHKINLLSLKNKKIILTLARLSTNEDKGQHRVLKSLPKIIEQIPNAVYLIVGGGNDDRINKFLFENPILSKSVCFTGEILNQEKKIFYNLADVFIMPSKTEGFGIVFIEALACGLPVICSDGYGCRGGLLGGELGKLVDPEDTNSISNIIIECLSKENDLSLSQRKSIRKKTIKVYGLKKWDRTVSDFLKSVQERI